MVFSWVSNEWSNKFRRAIKVPGHSSLDVEHIDVYRGVSVIQNEFYGKTTVGIGNLTILNFLKIGFQMVLFS